MCNCTNLTGNNLGQDWMRGPRRDRGAGGPPSWAGRGWRSTVPIEGPQLAPPPPNVLRIVAATMDGRGAESVISQRFARAPFLTVIDIADSRIVYTRSFPNPFAGLPHGAGMAAAQWIISIGAKAVLGARFGPNLGMVLQQAGVAIHTVPPGIRVLDALLNLRIIRTPY
ncbi:MAG: hypothetical protein DRJ51_03440 [Thermoprotei archaeon]|nr:MAG: hypothetical protein DRJ51_03440 [Thermoprotei archaeon]RLF02360.1 MAG: hypothetical protein DRJ59_03825 [Thermoprotei archaeon]